MDTSELSRVATWVPVARIGSSLLLKTSLPRSPGTAKDAAGKPILSIAGDNVSSNDSTVRQSRGVPFWIPAVGAPERISIDTNA